MEPNTKIVMDPLIVLIREETVFCRFARNSLTIVNNDAFASTDSSFDTFVKGIQKLPVAESLSSLSRSTVPLRVAFVNYDFRAFIFSAIVRLD